MDVPVPRPPFDALPEDERARLVERARRELPARRQRSAKAINTLRRLAGRPTSSRF